MNRKASPIRSASSMRTRVLAVLIDSTDFYAGRVKEIGSFYLPRHTCSLARLLEKRQGDMSRGSFASAKVIIMVIIDISCLRSRMYSSMSSLGTISSELLCLYD